MRLTGLAVGAQVPAGDFAGRIEEVHARTVLVAVAGGGWITLLAHELGRQPFGVTFAAPEGFSFRPLVAAGTEVAERAGVMRVAAGALAIDLREARPWRCGLDGLRLDLSRAAVARAYQTACATLAADGRSDGLHRGAAATLDRLADATRRLDAAAAEQEMARLVGFGEGRTPAGDDYLVGYFAALWACAATRVSFAATLGPRLAALAAQTERLSRLYLQAAAAGEVSERIAAVAAGIAAGNDDSAIRRIVAAALAVGHSSGAAAVLGLLQGSAVCARPPAQACVAVAVSSVFRRPRHALFPQEPGAHRRTLQPSRRCRPAP